MWNHVNPGMVPCFIMQVYPFFQWIHKKNRKNTCLIKMY